MSEKDIQCFIVMPFLPELDFFYLFIKEHMELRHNIFCSRADDRVLTIAILDKINSMILGSSIIIADCTGKNPNVMYELGIAHALKKDVILLTNDEISSAPSDIRHIEFIKYNLSDGKDFTTKLDNAVSNLLIRRYEELYKKATELFKNFKSKVSIKVTPASKMLFVSRVKDREIPDCDAVMIEFLLPKIIVENSDMEVIQEINRYVTEYPHG